MAVQKNRKTRAKRNMRRSHSALKPAALSEDSTTGTYHRRHHISEDGFYRGKSIIPQPIVSDDEDDETDNR